MDDAVRGSADCRVNPDGVLESLARQEFGDALVFLDQTHDLDTGHVREPLPSGIDCRDAAVIRQRDAQHLGYGRKARRRAHHHAGAARA